MRQIRITTKNLDFPQEDDCYLSPDDPVNQYRSTSILGIGIPIIKPKEVIKKEVDPLFINPKGNVR